MILPTHCTCGAVLMGGATRHMEGCWVLAIIRENFPDGEIAKSNTEPAMDLK